MNGLRLEFEGRSEVLNEGITTIGRSSDNDIAFPGDSNVSRHHAEIEFYDSGFWISDLGSSNGTTLNGSPLKESVLLRKGDKIVLGGTTELLVTVTDDPQSQPAVSAENEEGGIPGAPDQESDEENGADPPAEQKRGAKQWLVGCAGIAFGLAIISVFAAILVTQCGSPGNSGCDPAANISSPELADTIDEAVKVEFELTDHECVTDAVLSIGGREIAKVAVDPAETSYSVTLDPSRYPELSDGTGHSLTLDLLDGSEIAKADAAEVPDLYLETIEIEVAQTPIDEPVGSDQPAPARTPSREKGSIPLIKTNELVKNVISRLPENSRFAPETELLTAVQKVLPEYAVPGFRARAEKYRDVINETYIKEKGLDASIGYLLAMSRTRFEPASSGDGEGLWRMPGNLVADNNYNASCGDEMLNSESQNCAARASAEYVKALLETVFDGNVIYTVAVFGKSPQAAAKRRLQLPEGRTGFWRLLTRRERDQVARYLAAAIVAENPREFGLSSDRPLSELYELVPSS